MKKALNKYDLKYDLPSQFTHNGQEIKDKKKIAQQFNNFFSKIGQHISDDVPQSPIHYTEYLRHRNIHSFFLDPVAYQDIIDITVKFKTKSSMDCNNVSSKLMKATIKNTAHPLTHLFNLSLVSGIVPDDMKISKVVPIFKSGDKTKFTNYRPISILPTFSKILEKIVAKN